MEGLCNLTTLIISIILIEIFKVNQDVSRFSFESNRMTVSDYTIQLSGL